MLQCFPWTDSTLRIGQVEANWNGSSRTWIRSDNSDVSLVETGYGQKCLMALVFHLDRYLVPRKKMALKSVSKSEYPVVSCYKHQ